MCRESTVGKPKGATMAGTTNSEQPITGNASIFIEGKIDGDDIKYRMSGDSNGSKSRSKSPNVRFRMQNSSSSSSLKFSSNDHMMSGGGNTTINITNFGLISGLGNLGSLGGPAPWKKKQNSKEQCGWAIVRLSSAFLLLIWISATFSVLQTLPGYSSSEPSTSSSESASSSGIRGGVVENAAPVAVGVAADSTIQQHRLLDLAYPAIDATHLIESNFDIPPNQFQFDTPNAPSCSVPLDASDVSFTLVTQLSDDRVWMIQYHCQRWGDHPMSVVVFTDRDAAEVKSEMVEGGCSDEHLTVQTVSKTKYDPTGSEYPVNILRNLAFSVVKTTHVVYADVDFWPTSELHNILSMVDVKQRLASDSKLATVVPAFQMNRRCKDYRDCREMNIPSMPKLKKALLTLVKKRQASSFDPTNVGGHGSTKYITWREQEMGTFKDLPCIKSNRYEPYLVVRYCSDLPPFQEGFTGYGKNKMTWAMQLRRTGYLFSQLGGAFFVHYPHLDSASRQEWNKKPGALGKGTLVSDLLKNSTQTIQLQDFKRARVDALFVEFRDWMSDNVDDAARVPMCEDAQNDDARLWVDTQKN